MAAFVEAHSERCRAAVRLVDEARSRVAEAQLVAELARLDDRPVEIGLRESIAEALLELVEHVGARVERQRAIDRLRDRPELVDPVAMVAMGVRDDDAVETAHFGSQQLLPKIGPAIDEHALAAAFDQDRGSQPIIARLGGIALAPVVADLRNPGRRPAAENSNLQRSPWLS